MSKQDHSNKRKRDSEDADEEQPYSETQEPFPSHPAFDPRVEKLKSSATHHIDALLQHLAGNASVSAALRNMKGKAEKAMKMREPDRLMIALVGDTGAGKSSVLNAVTDIPGLARVVAGGESCTSVPTIYLDRLPLQSKDKPYAAGVRYLTIDDCSIMMQELLDNYNLWTFEQDRNWPAEMESEYSQSASSALQTFRTLFCRKDDFFIEEAARASLEEDYNAIDKTLHGRMVSWCRELLGNHVNRGEDYHFGEFDDLDDLREFVDELTLPSEDFVEPHLWPLVERVSIGAQSSRALKWVTIADLAGLSDTHKVRVKATHRHMSKCDAMWYVASVDRVITDPRFEGAMSEWAELFPNTLAVVVTKTDGGIDDALAKKFRTAKEDVERYFTLGKELKALEGKIKDKRARSLRLRKSGSAEFFAVAAEVEELQTDIENITSERLSTLMDARSRYITRRLREDKQKYLPQGVELPVFCVSNSQYFANKQVDGADVKLINPAATGIPTLRAYALELAAPAIWQETKAHLIFRVAGFFYGAYCWARADHKERRDGLMKCIKTVQKHWNFVSDPLSQEVQTLLANEFIKTLRDDQKKSLEGALEAFRIICEWNAGTFQAFFRKDGKHSTKAVGKECWNQLFLQEQTDSSLHPAWERVTPRIQHTIRSAIDSISETLSSLPDKLEREPGSAPLPAQAFHEMFRAHVAGIDAALQRRNKVYEHNLRTIKRDATADQPSAYFTNAMASVYEGNKRVGGAGCTARWKKALHEHLTLPGGKSPFAVATDELDKAMTNVAKGYVKGISEDVQSILDDVNQQMTGILAGGVESRREGWACEALLDVLRGMRPEIKRVESEIRALDARS